ncbi:MAG: hypothetical protein CMI06_01100 [Oceanospirillaceae bacterium]|nr:hypothetical protein [Oceanospirillaceae bacterium]|tara:strand:- start:692 stop:1786 length:1095 start_codon:yes stop_codon:yes gene_type:complete
MGMDSAYSVNSVSSDEIDLFDLIDDIKEKWYWLVGTVVLSLCLALVYAYTTTPVYQTEVVYKEVSDVDLLPLNQPRLQGIFSLSREKAFKEVRALARSGNSKRVFYNQLLAENNVELSALIYAEKLTEEQNFVLFSERFTYADPGVKETDVLLRIQFELSDPQWATQLLNRYSDFILQRYLDEVRNTLELTRDARLEALELEADGLRTKYLAQKNQRMLMLEEASSISASIKQKMPFYSGNNNALLGSQPPLFMMGQTVINSELSQIRSRAEQGEDAYISGLPELNWKIQNLKKAEVSWDKVRFVQLDQSAVLPLKPVKPRKVMIVALAGVAGGMAGVVFALLAAAQARRRNSERGRRAALQGC